MTKMRIGRGIAVAVALAVGAAATAAQQVLDVDMDAGRELAGGAEYSFRGDPIMDYGRRLVLVSEAADPLAVTAYSLEDGSVRAVFGGGRAGDGPGELTQVDATAVGPEGVYVAGGGRVLYWSWQGALLHQWKPSTPLTIDLCALRGRPAVPLQHGGLVFRDDDGESVVLDGEARTEMDWTGVRTNEEAFRVIHAYHSNMMACNDSAAYVLAGASHALTEHKVGAEPRWVPMPPELVEAARMRMNRSSESHFFPGYRDLFLAEDGRLVITTFGHWAGVVVDPATGCYALMRNRNAPVGWSYAGMFGDSVVTLEGSRQPTTGMVDGQRRAVYSTEETHIFVRPVRPVSGEPCPPRH